MKEIIKEFFALNPSVSGYRLKTGVSMLINLAVGITNIIIGIVKVSFYFYAGGIYNLVLTSARFYAVQKLVALPALTSEEDKIRMENLASKRLGVSVLIMSVIYLIFGLSSMFFYTEYAEYGIVLMLYTTTIAFTKLIFGIIGTIRTRKNETKLFYFIRLTNLCVGLISIALAQRAILFYMAEESAEFFSGMGSVMFSCAAICVCIVFMLRYNRQKR